ncbi:MAG: GNAT family N-acetyltransferase [Spirochaetaceae bacterium]|jgi:predicted N-acetyltransferase YhbS|nr:GNAT family N-acetyltransferase [Spirochaetaceae bacterium]
MSVQFEKAKPEDYGDVIDFGNYVFSHAHIPHDFPLMLPKLYKREYFMDGIHYLAREDGRIRAVAGAYPLEMQVPGDVLPGRGIGMVSVHPYYRSRGFMKALINMALEDMRREGMVFSCLSGQRQRYEYFGYAPIGLAFRFECRAANINHTLGCQFKTGLSLRRVSGGDRALLDYLYAMHESKPVRILRRREKFFDIVSSWKSLALAIMEGQHIAGYLLYNPNKKCIHEITLEDSSRAAECIGLFLQAGEGSRDGVTVEVQPWEREKIGAFSRFAESYSIRPAYSFAVFDYRRFILPFLKLKSSLRALPGGTFTLQIEGGPRLALGVSGGEVSAPETREPADLSLKPVEALGFLFSADYAAGSAVIGGNPFLQSLLPLPLSLEAADEV